MTSVNPQVQYIFEGFTPTPEQRPTVERFARIVNSVMKRTGITADTFIVSNALESAVSVTVLDENTDSVTDSIWKEKKPEYAPRICFFTVPKTILGSAKATDAQLIKQLEGMILHESWHLISPRQKLQNALYIYVKKLLPTIDMYEFLLANDEARAVFTQELDGIEKMQAQLDKLKALAKPFDEVWPQMNFLRHGSVSNLTDQFAKQPFTLLPEEKSLTGLPSSTEMIAANHTANLCLASVVKNHPEFVKEMDRKHPNFPASANTKRWLPLLHTYMHAIEFSCDEFAQANEQNKRSFEDFLTDDFREIIHHAASVASVTLTPQEIQTLEWAMHEGKQFKQNPEKDSAAYSTVVDEINRGFENDIDHPDIRERVRRLRTQDIENSPYRLPSGR